MINDGLPFQYPGLLSILHDLVSIPLAVKVLFQRPNSIAVCMNHLLLTPPGHLYRPRNAIAPRASNPISMVFS